MSNDNILLRFGADTSGAEEGARRVGGAVSGLDHEFEQFQSRLEGIAERLLILFEIHSIIEFADKLADAAARMDQLAQITSLSTKELREWDAIARANGKNVEEVAGSVGKLERAFVQARAGAKAQEAAFASLGINIKTVGSAQEALLQVADKFHGMEDGPRKYAAAVELMGRNGKEMIPILNLGSEAIKEQNKEAYDLGAVWGATTEEQDAFEKKALAVHDAIDRMHLATSGLSNALADALAPTIADITNKMADMTAGFVKSYREGGQAKVVTDALAASLRVIADVIALVGGTVYMVFQDIVAACVGIGGTIIAAFDVIGGAVNSTTEALIGMGNIIKDIFTLDWGAIGRDIKHAMDGFAREAHAGGALAGQAFKDGWKQAGQDVVGGANVMQGAINFAFGPKGAPKNGRGGRGEGGFDTTGGDTSAADAEAAKAAAARERRLREQLQAYVQELDDEQAALKDHFADQMALEEDKLHSIAGVYGRDSEEYHKELAKQTAMQRAHDQEILQIEQQTRAARAAQAVAAAESANRIAEIGFEQEKEIIQQQSALGLITDAERIRRETDVDARIWEAKKKLELDTYDLQMNALIMERDAEATAHSTETVAYAAFCAQIEALQASHVNKMAEISAGAAAAAASAARSEATAVLSPWKDAIDQISGGLASMFTGWASHMQTAAQAFQQFGQMLLGMLTQWLAKKIAMVVTGEATHTAAVAAGEATRAGIETAGAATSVATSGFAALAKIAQHAAVAAAAVYESIVTYFGPAGPFIAPALAAAAFAGVIALGSKIFSAEDGWGNVPFDGATTSLHKGEMVLPASIASPLRSAISTGQIGNGAGDGGAAGAGGVHHHWNVQAMDARSFREFARQNRATFFDMVTEALRGGSGVKPGMGQAS